MNREFLDRLYNDRAELTQIIKEVQDADICDDVCEHCNRSSGDKRSEKLDNLKTHLKNVDDLINVYLKLH